MGGAPSRRFFFRGRVATARPGETVLAALARDRRPALARSKGYHRPRGPFCGVGYCTGCLVRANDVPAVRACRHVVRDGDRIENANGWPSARFDLLGVLDLLFPGGVDALHGFRRPAFLTPLYQRVVRRAAGYGPAPARPSPPPAAPRLLEREVVIVGAGASGRAAALRLVAHGIRPLVLDRSLDPAAIPGVDLLGATTVAFLPAPGPDGRFRLLGFEEPDRGVSVRARTVVVATGGYDADLLFDDHDRPGVFTADGAEAVARAARRPLFENALLVGGGARSAELLDRLGDRVGAIVAPGEVRPETVRRASELGIPLYPRTLLLRAVGRSWVRGARLQRRGGGAPFSIPADAIVLAHRRLPHPQLFFQSGARTEWRPVVGAYFPVLDDRLATTVPGLYAVGTAADARPGSGPATGELVADSIAGASAAGAGALRRPADGPNELLGYYRELLPRLGGGRSIVCPCEDVLLDELRSAHAHGYAGIEVVKRYTSLGTGLCQGRYCLPDALLLLAILEGRPPAEVGFITQRPPVVPTPLAALAALPDVPPAEAGR